MFGLVRHNLKKAKGQFISFGLVMMITAVILNTALVLLFQTGNAYDRLFDELNTAEISVTVPEAYDADTLAGALAEISGVSDVEQHPARFASAALQEFQGSAFTMNTYFYRLSDERSLTRHTVCEQSDSAGHHGAYIPLYLSELGGYQTGSSIRYLIDGQEYRFTVDGVLNEMQYGNYGTGFIGIYLTDQAYESIRDDAHFMPVSEYLVKTGSGADIEAAKKAVADHLKEQKIPVLSLLDCETARNSRTMVSETIVLFLAVFALLVLTVSIFLARFRIRQTIDEEMNEMGVLKGIGYESRQLMFSQVIPYGIVCAAGLLLGTALSYLLIPSVANILAVQSGFSYRPVFDLKASAVTVFSILLTVLVFTLLAAGKIRRLEPIHAIRGIDPLRPAEQYSVGDPFSMTLNGTTYEYTVCGLIQSVNHNGMIAELTDSGYAALSDTPLYSLNLYTNGQEPDGYFEKMNRDDPDSIVSISNAAKETKAIFVCGYLCLSCAAAVSPSMPFSIITSMRIRSGA